MTRVLVCGGRTFSDTTLAYKTLDRLHRQYGFDVVIEGDQKGADRIAGYWARRNRLDDLKFKADWSDLSHSDAVIKTRLDGSKYDAKAGIRRNQRMLDEGHPDLVIAFPGGVGTADMVRRANAAGIEVIELLAPTPETKGE